MNVSSLKTPGVYINEIDAFPPSVAQVATAIPAFIGYTEKGPSVPVRISSLLEFQQIFGSAPSPDNITINMGSNIYEVAESKFKLYNSLNLFYANGGGVCYIVSIGQFSSNPTFASSDDFITGLNLLRNFDEPTLLLSPDAVNLSADNLAALQQQMLLQCSDLMDRFSIFDVKPITEVNKSNLIASSESFRDKVGNMNLKYGASYYPDLQVNASYKFRFSKIDAQVNFASIYASDPVVLPLITKFKTQYDIVYKPTAVKGIVYQWNEASFQSTKDKVVIANDFTNTNAYFLKLVNLLGKLGKTSTISDSDLKKYVENVIATSLRPYLQSLIDFKAVYNTLKDPATNAVFIGGKLISATIIAADFEAIWGTLAVSAPNPYTGLLETSTPLEADLNKIQLALDKLRTGILAAMNSGMTSIENYIEQQETTLIANMPLYAEIVAKLAVSMNTVPPSGAIAGIYAKTDATRGVWKSPANVSINGIIGLTDDINDANQEDMNIHETGKSINAIRKFTGKGFLVWGGRTLAGNSNDWRYVNVRRLANMIEESVKKACMQFVFEPNVSLTWVSVKGMIDNYLATLWKDGALAGSKTEHAFFVSIGLNETMSAQDILEGRMIVKVGYAPSRPAEFIILEFKQMQQKS
ncbi:phage tail sheath family protein [Flavobacterium sp. HNIBRBA15423]|uniref:phage tail sheath family protein n=1 Tax=Flavobacterium sp. HNIBRBA15423 TaxID=3458683 RepID=UPI004045040E